MPPSLLPPKWKRDREWRRLRRQARESVGLITAPTTRLWWDQVRARRIGVANGACAPCPKVALFLVFQPGGIASSTFQTLDCIAAEGYAPLVVVNGPVSGNDLAQLKHRAWRVLNRPNIGYDFGGYRDGIWHLQTDGTPIDALMVLNDTVWLPVCGAGQSLRWLAQADAPYAALSNFVYRPGRKRHRGLTGGTYASSFGFRIDGAVWRSEAFGAFWRALPVQNVKRKVVEQGEVGFSHAMTQAGVPPVTLLDHATIADRALQAPRDWQTSFIARLPVLGGAALRAEQAALLAAVDAGTALPDAPAAFLRKILPTLNPWDSMVVQGLVEGQIDFIKKANLKTPDNARRFLATLDRTDVTLQPTVRSEIAAIAARATD